MPVYYIKLYFKQKKSPKALTYHKVVAYCLNTNFSIQYKFLYLKNKNKQEIYKVSENLHTTAMIFQQTCRYLISEAKYNLK